MANGIMDVFLHKHFHVLLLDFSPCPGHLSKNTVSGHAFKTPEWTLERILTVDATEPHLPQSEDGEGTFQTSDSSDKDDSPQSAVDPEQ